MKEKMKMNKIKILNYIWTTIKTIFYLCLGSVLLIIISQRIFNNASVFGYRIFTVASGSMEPKYKILDMIIVKEINPKDIKVKDDIVYQGKEESYAGKIITHRVIEIKENKGKREFITQGIANPLKDPLVHEDQIYGKVLHKFIILSIFNRILNNPLGFILLIVLPIAILFLLEIIDMKNKRDELNESE